MDILLTIHLLAIGIWIGIVAAEFAIEFDGMNNQESLIKAAKLHYLTDIWVEIPALIVVLVTGLMMLEAQHLSGLFLVKIAFAGLAIIFNLICVYAVVVRRRYALLGDIEGMRSTDTAMKLGAGVIPTFLIAFGLGVYLAHF